MLATLKEVLAIAEKNGTAIGAINTPTLENVVTVIQNAEELGVPVILAHAELHEPEAPLSIIGKVMVMFAKEAKVPVCVHLDHGEHLWYIEEALKLGFTSVMYDGSALPYESNVRNTRKAVKMAREYGASVEAEIGSLANRESGVGEGGGAVYTDPELAVRFAKDTGIDALACSFGTAHGIYKVKPKLDFERIEKIHKLIGIPLVMHGGSGLPPEDYRRAMELGVKKINYYSYMGRAGLNEAKRALAEDNPSFYHEIAAKAKVAMKEDCMKALRVFSKKEL